MTNNWIEDHGTASASGLYDIRQMTWSEEILDLIRLKRATLLPLVERHAIAGKVTAEAASRFGIRSGIPVVAGSGDGFLASSGSACDKPNRVAVTLGTSSSARQMLSSPVLDDTAGTFCYCAHAGAFLLGCASSNGGNVLDWARSVFGKLPSQTGDRADLPTFLPLLHGERSPEWNEKLTASWHGINSTHTAEDLATAVVDGVVFNLGHYVDILERASGVPAREIILSGNGFLNPLTAPTLAAVVEARVLQPRNQGLASLSGAAICAFQGLGINVLPSLQRTIADADVVRVAPAAGAIRRRYIRYRELRGA